MKNHYVPASSQFVALAAAHAEATGAGGGGQAVKHDEHKLRYDLLPVHAIDAITAVLTFGAKKYDPHNWRNGLAWSRLYRAALGHLFAWARGEETDHESGMSHLAHVGCCVLFLIESQLKGYGTDDRIKD